MRSPAALSKYPPSLPVPTVMSSALTVAIRVSSFVTVLDLN
jgi:hypothetical protein